METKTRIDFRDKDHRMHSQWLVEETDSRIIVQDGYGNYNHYLKRQIKELRRI